MKTYRNPQTEGVDSLVSEPSVAYAYAVPEVEANVEYLPADIIRDAVECAMIEKREGTLISSDDILSSVYEELGWK